jgi:hypothetical protein
MLLKLEPCFPDKYGYRIFDHDVISDLSINITEVFFLSDSARDSI